MHVSDYRATDKHVFCRALPSHHKLASLSLFTHRFIGGGRAYQVRPPHLVDCLCVVEFDVEVLVYALERAADLDFVFEFDGDFVLDERFEETVSRRVRCVYV
jgi:hypothetical protein